MRQLIVFLFLTGCCCYTFNPTLSLEGGTTLSVPYIEGDVDGLMTAALIKEVASSGAYTYRHQGAEWILKVRVIDDSYENIGFRYDRSRKGRLKNWIIPVEMREGILVEVELYAACPLGLVRGPCQLYADIEYDHDYYTIRDGVNVFSLGQLTDIDSAEDAAQTPLYQRLAEKIVSWLLYN